MVFISLIFVKHYLTNNYNVITTCRDPLEAKDLQSLKIDHNNLKIEALNVSDRSQ